MNNDDLDQCPCCLGKGYLRLYAGATGRNRGEELIEIECKNCLGSGKEPLMEKPSPPIVFFM
jgi:hypothetical protein